MGNRVTGATVRLMKTIQVAFWLGALGMLVTAALAPLSSAPLQLLIGIAVIISLLSCAQLHALGLPWTSATVAFLAYLSLYHLGMTAVFAFFPDTALRYKSTDVDWVFSQENKLAIVLVSITAASYVLGGMLASAKQPLLNRHLEAGRLEGGEPFLFWPGQALISVAAWLLLFDPIQRAGLSVFVGQYMAFRDEILSGSGFQLGVYLLGLGIILSVVGAGRLQLRIALLEFAVLAVPLLVSGNRGEVLYPALTVGILLARRCTRMPTFIVILVGASLLLIIPIVSQFRIQGLSSVQGLTLSLDPLAFLVEVGYALRPVETIVTWVQFGEPHLNGASYWLPVERMLAMVDPLSFARTHEAFDPRFVQTYVALRTGAWMGFSPVAEAYYNFGLAGCVFTSTLLGFFITAIDRRASTALRLAVLGVVLFPLINSVRNSFIFVPGQILMGLAPLIVLWVARACSKPIVWWNVRQKSIRKNGEISVPGVISQ